MALDAHQMVKKLSFVLASRFLQRVEAIEQFYPFPANVEQEDETMDLMIHDYLKKRFVGCKTRKNRFTYSVRLDGEVNRKAIKVREVVLDNTDWRQWFQTNHRDLYRAVSNNNRSFDRGGNLEVKEQDGKKFVYVPYQRGRIPNYGRDGVLRLLEMLENEWKKDETIATHYENAITLMENEIHRREEERRIRIEKQRTEFLDGLHHRLLTKLEGEELARTGNTIEGKLARKMYEWCVANGKEPAVANAPTYQNVVPVGTNVGILSEIGSKEKNWFAVPLFDQIEVPENYKLHDGYGKVTRHDTTHERAIANESPIIVEEYIFTGFDLAHWQHLFPEGYAELLEKTEEIRAVATEEFNAEQAQAAREREEADRRSREEAARIAQEAKEREEREAQRKEALRLELLAQLQEQKKQEATPAVEVQAVPVERNAGLYMNNGAIPLERYVAICTDGSIHRCASLQAAVGYCDTDLDVVRDYNSPETVLMRYQDRAWS